MRATQNHIDRQHSKPTPLVIGAGRKLILCLLASAGRDMFFASLPALSWICRLEAATLRLSAGSVGHALSGDMDLQLVCSH